MLEILFFIWLIVIGLLITFASIIMGGWYILLLPAGLFIIGAPIVYILFKGDQ
jgi:hypothetical protein